MKAAKPARRTSWSRLLTGPLYDSSGPFIACLGPIVLVARTGVSLAPFNNTGFIEMLWRSKLESADLGGTDLSGADLTHVSLRFANLKGANLKGAILQNADLSHADLTGADLTGANLSHADLDSTKLTGVKGLDTASGMATALNREKAIN